MNLIPKNEHWKSDQLKQILVFPVYAYNKENGFLGMVSYNWNTDNLLVCSKSTNDGEFVEYLQRQLNTLTPVQMENLKSYVKNNNHTLVFECVDIENDPHIIKYDKSKLVLLDIVHNEFDFIKEPYEKVIEVANLIGVDYKKLSYTFNTWEELYGFIKEQDESYDIRYEGWVFEDQNQFMFKYKTRFYKFWKQMRAVKERLQQGNNVKKIFSTEHEVRVFNLLKQLNNEGKLNDLSIIDVEDMYYSERKI